MRMAILNKHLGVAALALGMAVGCATTQQPQAEAEVCEGMSAEVRAAIEDAQAQTQDARARGADWREARDLIRQAEAAGEDCRDAEALQLAREAELTADKAIAAYQSEQAQTQPMDMDRSYTVSRGDTLWGIAGSSVGYNDPYQWPLIYKANTDQIQDADLIYPGQDLTIDADPSAAAIGAAVEHARTRGEWSVGRVEGSDRRYLGSAP